MRALLDTCALIWWFRAPKKLSDRASKIMQDGENTIYVSAASGLEISTKENLGKADWLPFVLDLERWVEEEGFHVAPLTLDQSIRAGLLPLHHKDPFDRLLVAQAQALNVPILSVDAILDQYGVKRVW